MPDLATYQPVLRSFPDREVLGTAAAGDIGDALTRRLDSQPEVRVIFASAPSQEATFRHLGERPGIDWSRVTAFHMDEYLGLAPDAPQRFGNWLRSALLGRVPVGTAHLSDPGDDLQARWTRLWARPGAAPVGLDIG